MKPIKFETVKRNAVREFYNKIGGNNHGLIGLNDSTAFLALVEQINTGTPARDVIEEWTEYGTKLIENWDIRAVSRLVDCFPSCVPLTWKGKRLGCEMLDNDNCDWVVFPLGAK